MKRYCSFVLIVLATMLFGVRPANATVYWRHAGTAPLVPGGIHSNSEFVSFLCSQKGLDSLLRAGLTYAEATEIRTYAERQEIVSLPQPVADLPDVSVSWHSCGQSSSRQVTFYKTVIRSGYRHQFMQFSGNRVSQDIVQMFDATCWGFGYVTRDHLYDIKVMEPCGNLTGNVYLVRKEKEVEVREKVVVERIPGPPGPPGREGPPGQEGPPGHPGPPGERVVNNNFFFVGNQLCVVPNGQSRTPVYQTVSRPGWGYLLGAFVPLFARPGRTTINAISGAYSSSNAQNQNNINNQNNNALTQNQGQGQQLNAGGGGPSGAPPAQR